MERNREGDRSAEAGQSDHPVVQPHARHSAEHHREVPAPAHEGRDPLRPALRRRQGTELAGRTAHTNGLTSRAQLHRTRLQDGGGIEGPDAGEEVRGNVGWERGVGVGSRSRGPPGQGPILKLYHPIYTLFKLDPNFDKEAWKAQHHLRKHVFLFFGFIRKYKGLHYCIEAFSELAKQRDDVSLMIVGERFWQTVDQSKLSTKLKNALFGTVKKLFLKKADDEREYDPLAMIGDLGLKDKTLVVDRFIPNEEVPPYFQAADTIVLFYETATPSGVESLSYNFKLPAVATRVGHFPETITDGFNGYMAEPKNIADMVRVMNASIEQPIPRENVVEATKEMSWANYAKAILRHADK
ncbi:MAG: glycosyltransferase [Flavobacteriales bacterium]|nr:glycosyltransferase [Flavobacteriales bacterium]